MATEIVNTFCQHCHMGCRLSVTVKDGKIVNIDNKSGIQDIKFKCSADLIGSPDRVIYPMRRTGERGSGKWERISWDAALDIMADRFGRIKEKYGPEAIATIMGCGHKLMATVATFLFGRVLGTPQLLDVNYQCTIPAVISEIVTLGTEICGDIGPQYNYSKCVVLWGASVKHCRPPHERDINMARAKGAQLIVVNPMPPQEVISDKAGLSPAVWLRVRPGTDAALALGMINVVIQERLYDKHFVGRWCVGFEELKRRAGEYPLEKVAKITWIPEEKIVEAARLFATSKPACLHLRLGAGGQQVNATQTSRAVVCLVALLGNIDIKGGNLIADKLGGFRASRWMTASSFGPIPPDLEEKRFGFKEFPFIAGSSRIVKDLQPLGFALNPTGFEAMLEGGIKAFFVPGSNVVLNEGDSRRTWEALKKLAFLVVVDLFMTPTAELADLVLPAAHFLETEIPMRAWQRMGPAHQNYILAPRKVVEPAGECWDDRKIVIELAKRMNGNIPWETIRDLNNWQLELTGLKYGDLIMKPGQMVSYGIKYKKYRETGFNTPSGKIELYSSIFKKHGYDPLPYYSEPPESPYSTPELWRNYPLILVTRRSKTYIHSEFRQIPSVRKEEPDFFIEINLETAAELGIRQGDEIYIERAEYKDRVCGKAKLVSESHPKVVACTSHWWYPEKPGPEHGCFDSNINTLMSTRPPYDPVNGNSQIQAIICRVGKKG